MESEFVLLDCGHGSCAVVRDGDKVFVVDAGGGPNLLRFFLSRRDWHDIDTFIISHADRDHIAGAAQLLMDRRSGWRLDREFRIRNVLVNSDARSGAHRDELFAALVAAEQLSTSVDHAVAARRNLNPGGTLDIEVVAPSGAQTFRPPTDRAFRIGDKVVTAHCNSVVVKISVRGSPGESILLPGDLDENGFSWLRENKMLDWLQSKVVVMPHHGGSCISRRHGNAEVRQRRNKAFVTSFLEAVSPSRVLISNGRERFKNPRPEVVQSILGGKATRILQCTQMSRNCVGKAYECSDAADHLAELDHEVHRNLRNQCAGTIHYSLDGVVTGLVDHSLHQVFIGRVAPERLCRPRPIT